MATVGIIGGSGFIGAELLRLVGGHPDLDLVFATGDSRAGTSIASLYPSLAGLVGAKPFDAWDPVLAEGVDVVFCALPHGVSAEMMPEIRKRAGAVIDMAADFRLKDAALYPQWYGEAHAHPELLGDFVYGLPELFRSELVGADAVAAPGCYPTTAALALAPLLRFGAIEPVGIVVDAASGVSGAGRDKLPFCGTDENFAAYGLLDHRHTPEIEQTLATQVPGGQAQVLFTPHLAPMNRGILATCYARPTGAASTEMLLEVMHEAYRGERFVIVGNDPPQTKATQGSNACHITVRYDQRTGWVVALAALDNLVKGAAGQGIQCANIILGLDEAAGLSVAGLYP